MELSRDQLRLAMTREKAIKDGSRVRSRSGECKPPITAVNTRPTLLHTSLTPALMLMVAGLLTSIGFKETHASWNRKLIACKGFVIRRRA